MWHERTKQLAVISSNLSDSSGQTLGRAECQFEQASNPNDPTAP